jgi:non-specific serine/threonine protein kinase
MSGWLLYHVGDHERAIATLERTSKSASAAGDHDVVALCYHVVGAIHDGFGRFDDALHCFERTREHFVATGHPDWHAHALNGLAHANFERGEVDLAEGQFEEALSILRSRDNAYGLGIVMTNLAKVARARGDPGRAIALYNESLAMRWQVGDKLGVAGCLRGLGQTCVLVGMWELAARLLGADAALRDAIGASLPQHRIRYDQSVDRLRRELGENRFTALWEQGRDSPLSDIVLEALERASEPGSQRAIAPSDSKASFDLTARELEVLGLVCEGLSNRAISERLFVSERTAQSHVQHIFDKLEVHSRASAVSFAITHGLVSPSPATSVRG